MRSERGQATIEWVGLVLLASLVLGALAAAVPLIDGRSFGGFLSHRIVCAVKGSACAEHDRALARAYGERDAALLRRYAPGIVYEPGERQLPVDFRRCRRVQCANAPPDERPRRPPHPRRRPRHRLHARDPPRRAHLPPVLALLPRLELDLRRARTCHGSLAGRRRDYPGYHDDDWEGHVVTARPRRPRRGALDLPRPLAVVQAGRLPRPLGPAHRLDPRVAGQPRRPHPARPQRRAPPGGRVGGGRAGRRVRYRARIPGVNLRERTTTAEGLRLVPLETIAQAPLPRA